ncbi:uncharacterized protein LOC106640885 [Copidosoma floridanum]|uniref:uncharacterized protein LOC106640885 n=1 Tax=Copidosoma floridanum TaxID=29053 RepID=UPI0006C9787B|nr:uncharacterized protein LOC106640885 [Copidosoma floridanum]
MLHPLESLQALDRDLGTSNLFIALIVSKFNSNTNKDWQRRLGSDASPPLINNLKKFLTTQVITLEACENLNTSSKAQSYKPQSKPIYAVSHQFSISESTVESKAKLKGVFLCLVCCGDHSLGKCEQFKAFSTGSKLALIVNERLCFNCHGKHF